MKTNYIIISIILFAAVFQACKKDEDATTLTKPVVKLPYEIRTNRTLKNDTVYTFESSVIITDNAILTIEPGTVIKSKPLEKGRSGSIVIDRGAKIMAVGTPEQPIVFTSGSPAGQQQHGDWTGLYILGKAPVSAYDENTGEQLNEMPFRAAIGYVGGGNNPDDNSGVLKYVRIEFAGSGSDNSYGLGCVGVGYGTTIENIQASFTQTSGFGFYGGTVNARNLVAFNNRVAGFVYANGYTGKQQFIVSYKHPYFAAPGAFIYTCDGVLAFNDMYNNPLVKSTRPVISNLTVIGPYNNPGYNEQMPWNAAVNINYGSAFVLRNTVIMGMPKGGIKFSDDAAAGHLLNGTTAFSNNLVHSNIPEEAFTIDPNNVFSIDAAFVNSYALNHHNTSYKTPDLLSLTDPFNFKLPGLLPIAGSPALGDANFDGADFNSFFEKVTYRGAFGSINWMEGWTNFYPVTINY